MKNHRIQRELNLTLARRSTDASFVSPLLMLIVMLSTTLASQFFAFSGFCVFLMSFFGSLRFRHVKRYLKAPDSVSLSPAFRLYTTAMALTWGAFISFSVSLDSYHWTALFALLVMCGLCAGAVPALSPDPICLRLFLTAVLIPVICTAFWVGNMPIGIVSALFLAYLVSQGSRYVRWLRNSLETQFELRLKTKQLEKANREAEAAIEARSLFLATMSHEIRTPLNGVIGLTGLLLDTPLDREQQDYTVNIRRCGEALLAILNDILDFSKLEADMMELEYSPFELRNTLEDVTDLLSYQAHQKGLRLDVSIQSSLPDHFRGDPTRLKQILLNLLSNAIKFTARGRILLRAEASDREGVVRFEITDTGKGIPSDRFHKLFREFSQVDSSTSREFGGTGLGLAICQRLVEAMRGRIGVESVEGEGSTFWFELGLEQLEEAPRHRPLGDIEILLIPSDEEWQDGLTEQLAYAGATVERWSHQSDGSPKNCTPDLILVEYPGSDRALSQIFERLRTLELLGHIRLVLTAPDYHTVSSRDAELQHVSAVLVSPVRHLTLSRTLLKAVGRESGESRRLAKIDKKDQAFTCRVLVVEDNRVNQKLLTRVLSKLGCRSDVASNGKEAVEAVKRLPYDLVLMDYLMPVMDGIEATKEIRKDFDSEALPIVAVTANASVIDRDQCLAAGMNDYLTKPVRPGQLEELLKKFAK